MLTITCYGGGAHEHSWKTNHPVDHEPELVSVDGERYRRFAVLTATDEYRLVAHEALYRPAGTDPTAEVQLELKGVRTL